MAAWAFAPLALCAALNAFPARAGSANGSPSSNFRTHAAANGWIELCARQPNECAGATTALRNIVLTPNAGTKLVHVNKHDEIIKHLTDLDHLGLVELWSYPDDGYDDCGDYVLLKRRILIQSGWPRETLLVSAP
jgi:predicted transglutaminase-like cysteine proteinase